QRHEAVAEKLIDGALVAVNFGERALEEPVEQRVHLLGAEAFGQSRGVHDVTEEDGHELVLAVERRFRARHAFGDVLRGVAGRRCQARSRRTLLSRRPPTGSAKSLANGELGAARRAPHGQGSAAILAEVRAVAIFSVAAKALHVEPPARRAFGIEGTASVVFGRQHGIDRPPRLPDGAVPCYLAL